MLGVKIYRKENFNAGNIAFVQLKVRVWVVLIHLNINLRTHFKFGSFYDATFKKRNNIIRV